MSLKLFQKDRCLQYYPFRSIADSFFRSPEVLLSLPGPGDGSGLRFVAIVSSCMSLTLLTTWLLQLAENENALRSQKIDIKLRWRGRRELWDGIATGEVGGVD